MANGKKPMAGDADHNEAGYKKGTYNVIEKRYFGDPGSISGAGLSEAEADAYIADRMKAQEGYMFEKVLQ